MAVRDHGVDRVGAEPVGVHHHPSPGLGVVDHGVGRLGPELVAGPGVVVLDRRGGAGCAGSRRWRCRWPAPGRSPRRSVRGRSRSTTRARPGGARPSRRVDGPDPRRGCPRDRTTSSVADRVVQAAVVLVAVHRAGHPQHRRDPPGQVDRSGRRDLELVHPGRLAPEAAPLGDPGGVDHLDRTGARRRRRRSPAAGARPARRRRPRAGPGGRRSSNSRVSSTARLRPSTR